MPTQVVPAPNSKADGLPQVQESVLEQTEEWRTVVGFPNYKVSNCGRVWGKKSERILNTALLKGYVRVGLRRDGRQFQCQVHHLVLGAFVEPRPPTRECNHIDGNKLNNRVANLEWVTRSENMKHAFRLGLNSVRGERSPRHKLSAAQVLEIRRMASLGDITQRQIGLLFNVTNISDIVRRKVWKYV